MGFKLCPFCHVPINSLFSLLARWFVRTTTVAPQPHHCYGLCGIHLKQRWSKTHSATTLNTVAQRVTAEYVLLERRFRSLPSQPVLLL